MMRFFILLLIFFSTFVDSKDVSFQLYLYDNVNKKPLHFDENITVNSSFIDGNNKVYFEKNHLLSIKDGFLHLKMNVDLKSDNDVFVFDQKDLKLKLKILDDELVIPITVSSLAVLSELTDRTAQIEDLNLLKVDYNSKALQIGGSTVTKHAINIAGSLKATTFVGDGEYIFNVRGSGLSDDHSLEKNFSRNCPPSNLDNECKYGDDILFISNDPYVGINTSQPKMPFDSRGRVLFTKGETNAGVINFPLKKHQSLMAWDHQNGSFKAGYVSRDVSVKFDSFSHSTISIGKDIATTGRNSGVFGGETNTINGNYSAIIGGKNNSVTGDYSVVVGSNGELVHKGYVANIGSESNIVSSNYAVLLSSKKNKLSGNYHTIIGNNNVISGSDVFIHGDNNQVNANNVIVMGNAAKVDFNNSWIVNMSTRFLAQPTKVNQVIWMVDNGISVNTNNISEALVVDGDIKATTFRGDGSKLTNLSLVDKYWFMDGMNMTIEQYSLALNTVAKNKNQLNLKNGLILSSDGSTRPGTLSYINGDLVGTARTATHSLTIQDKDTTYNVSSILSKTNNQIALATKNVKNNDYLVFDGQNWVYSNKETWNQTVNSLRNDRAISLWSSNNYQGRFTITHPVSNIAQFVNAAQSKGLSIKMGKKKGQNQPISLGFNINTNTTNNVRYDDLKTGYLFDFDSLSGGFFLQDHLNNEIFEIEPDGKINIFQPQSNLSFNVPTVSQVSQLVLDSKSEFSSFATLTNLNYPMIMLSKLGELSLQSTKNTTINIRILPKTYSSIDDQNRFQLTSAGEVLLSHNDLNALDRVMLNHPDGDFMIDDGAQLGVFDSNKQRQVGLKLQNKSIELIPSNQSIDTVYINPFGLGLRTESDRALVIKDLQGPASMFIQHSPSNHDSGFLFSRESTPRVWGIQSKKASGSNSQLVFNNKFNQSVFVIDDYLKININSPEATFKNINVNGHMSHMGSKLKFMPLANSDTPSNSKPVIEIDEDQSKIMPIKDDAGLYLRISGSNKMNFKHGKVAIGPDDVPISPTKNLYVKTGAYLDSGLYYFDEKIEHKEIKTPVESHKHSLVNTVQTLNFDYDTGFEINSTSNYRVGLTFQPHFSTFNTIALGDDIDADTQYITPNGIDVMGFLGDNISVSANNVSVQGNPNGQMDSLTFLNDLMNGGVINGNLLISGTLNVIGIDPKDNDAHKIIGDISEMQNIPFPWVHVVTENGILVDYEYVITENVGIGTTLPIYPFEVDGTSSINVVLAPSINATGTLVPYSDDFMIRSVGDMTFQLNRSSQEKNQLLKLNNLYVHKTQLGLNDFNSNYFMSFYPYHLDLNSQMIIQGRSDSRVNLGNGLTLNLDTDGDLSLFAKSDVKSFYLKSNQTRMSISETDTLGINIKELAKNSLDVSGNVSIGSSLSGQISAPKNSVMVQSKLGVGTDAPSANVDVQGSMVIGDSISYMGAIVGLNDDLVVETPLFIEEYEPSDITHNVQINGSLALVGGLFFNKASNENTSELSFAYNDSNRLNIGYGSDVSSRKLLINSMDYTDLTPATGIDGLFIDGQGKIGLGHDTPLKLFHIRKPNIEMRLEAKGNSDGDVQLLFESAKSGVIGYSSNVPNQMVISDGENLEIAGADMSIDANGSIDIGYNVKDPTNSPQPSHNVKVDVLRKINATDVFRKNGAVLTHMPEGSVVMWSGWRSELPDGWFLCTGVDSTTTTSKCNFVDYFVVGKESVDKINQKVDGASHEYAIATGTEYQHTHSSDHVHTAFTEASHSHDQITIQNNNTTTTTSSNDVPSSKVSIGTAGYSYWERYGWDSWCACGKWRRVWVDYDLAPSGFSSNNGKHNHSVLLNHGHTASTDSPKHTHELASTNHKHEDVMHTHDIDNKPEYYTLAFIYLVGENQ